MKRTFLISAMVMAILLVFSCKKGDTGPAGPQGPTGPTGPQGPAGPTGTANVIYSDWFSFQVSEWKDTVMTNIGNAKRAIKIAAGVTQDILDKGVVLAYFKADDLGAGPNLLPFIYNKNPAGAYEIIPRVGSIVFYNYFFDNSGGQNPSTTHKWRYIIIPGGTPGGRLMNFAGMEYKEVCSLLNIPE